MSYNVHQTVKAEYEGDCPSRIVVELDDERLLAVREKELWGQISEDVGRTWSEPFRFEQGGHPMAGQPSAGCSLVLLSDGRLGMAYFVREESGAAGYRTRTWYFAISEDDGHTWSDGHRVDMPGGDDTDMGKFDQFMFGKVIQLSTGRIVSPTYWLNSGRHVGMPPTYEDPVTGTIGGKLIRRVADGHMFEAAMGGSYTYHSDDLGETWQRSIGSVAVWPLPSEEVGGFGNTTEPTAIELKAGRVMMHLRTNTGTILESFSENGGHDWSQGEPTGLASGDLPNWLGRIKSTGDLLTIWNQTSPEEIRRGYSRGRLSIAISTDEAASWGHHQTVGLSPGLEPAEYVEPPPVKHVRSDTDLGVLPDDWARIDYPRLAFVQGRAVLIYNYTVYDDGVRVPQERLTVVPEEDLYI
jgi:hypothetical protein